MAEPRPDPIRLGTIAPNFKADTTKGPIDFHEFVGDSWVVFFSHPEDYTPVCTTELGAFSQLEPEFTKRGVKLIGLSANTVGSHEGWIADIKEVTGGLVNFPIIADKERKVAFLYDMLDYQDTTNVDEKGIVRFLFPNFGVERVRANAYSGIHNPICICHRPKENHSHHSFISCFHWSQHQ
jgi:glutaredoxin/glutathione-dependent peroxiredoxin